MTNIPGISKIISRFRKNESPPENLTERETQIFNFIMDGLTYDEMASHMSIKMGTVTKHASNIFQKSGLNCRTELEKKYRKGHKLSKTRLKVKK